MAQSAHRVHFELDVQDLEILSTALEKLLEDPEMCEDCLGHTSVLFDGFSYALYSLALAIEEEDKVRAEGEV